MSVLEAGWDSFLIVNLVTKSFLFYLLDLLGLCLPLSISMTTVLVQSFIISCWTATVDATHLRSSFFEETCDHFFSLNPPGCVRPFPKWSKSSSHPTPPHPVFKVPWVLVFLRNNALSCCLCMDPSFSRFISSFHFLLKTVLPAQKPSQRSSLWSLSLSLSLWPLCYSRYHIKL